MNMKRFIGFIVLFLLLTGTAVSPPTAHAAPTAAFLTVCASGCDHTTITAAIAAATAGDTITVMNAVHTEQGIVIDKNLTIQGLGAGNTIVQAHATAGAATNRVFLVSKGVTATIQNMTIRHGNTIIDGGGINNFFGTLTVNNSIISGNSAGASGGGIINLQGTLTVNNSTFSGNSATYGGGIYSTPLSGTCAGTPQTIVRNSTFSGNSADYGGGIRSNNGVIEISHSTITANTAAISGAGVWSYNDVGATCTRVANSIIAGNTGGGDVAAELTTQRFFSLGYNVIGTAGANVNFTLEFNATGDTTGASPMLGPLANNGGPTLTHKPLSGSPAIDTGTASCGTAIDQRGAARPYNGNCDKGAVEVRETLTVGACGGADLSGPQLFSFATSGNQVTVNVATANGLKCITMEEMGPGANHLLATGTVGNPGIYTNNWWHINGNINNGFVVGITLPYASANALSRNCKWPGNLGGDGWDCGPLDGTGTTYVANSSVTRTGLASFSDWAVGASVGPTAVTNLQTDATSGTSSWGLVALLVGLLGVLTTAVSLHRRQARSSTF